MRGGRLIVGAPNSDVGGAPNAGAAYILDHVGASFVQSGSRLFAETVAANDYFGSSVSVYGDVAVIGVPNADGSAADADQRSGDP